MTRRFLAPAAVLMAVFAIAPAGHADPIASNTAQVLRAWKPGVWQPRLAAPASAGMRVAIDPETGTLVPAPAEPAAEPGSLAALRADEVFVVREHANGSRSVVLDGRRDEYMVVRLDSKGRPHFACVESPAAVQRALSAPMSAPVSAPVSAPAPKWEDR